MTTHVRALRLGATAAVLAGLAACAPQGGPGGIAPGTASGPQASVTVQAGGRAIRVTPPPGFCVDPASVRPQGPAAFVLIEDCALAAAGGIASANTAPGLPIERPAVINGIVTLSIGDQGLFGQSGDREAAFAALEAFLRSAAGRASAGRGGDAASIRVIEARRAGDTLYLLVEDAGNQVLPVLGERFWRGFTEVRGRAMIASLGIFDGTPMRDAEKLGHLARVMQALKEGNGETVAEAERSLAMTAPPSAAAAAPTRTAAAAPAPPAPRPGAAAPTPATAAAAFSPTAAPVPGGSALAPARAPLFAAKPARS